MIYRLFWIMAIWIPRVQLENEAVGLGHDHRPGLMHDITWSQANLTDKLLYL